MALSDVSHLKALYLATLPVAQEFYLEELSWTGSGWLIREESGAQGGYLIQGKDGRLLEYYLHPAMIPRKEEIFRQILAERQITEAFCKSYDALLVACCHTFSTSSSIFGLQFRDYLPTPAFEFESGVTIRLAASADIPHLLTYTDSDLYDAPDELDFNIRRQWMYLIEKDGQLIGCGYLIRSVEGQNYFDIGMWVNPRFRRRGYGTRIISYLKNRCLERGDIPVCACAVGNLASRKTLEKNGFVSRYCLLDFKFDKTMQQFADKSV